MKPVYNLGVNHATDTSAKKTTKIFALQNTNLKISVPSVTDFRS